MTYKAAEEMGRFCGLTRPAEFVNNAIHHASQMFPYSKLEEEVLELRRSAQAAGVRFSEVCWDAVLEGDRTDEPCYICKKLEAAVEDAREKYNPGAKE